MLAELNDGHTGLLSPSVRSSRCYFATCRTIGDAVVVDEVGKTAMAATSSASGCPSAAGATTSTTASHRAGRRTPDCWSC